MSEVVPEVVAEAVVPAAPVPVSGPSDRMRIFSGVTSILSVFSSLGLMVVVGSSCLCMGITSVMRPETAEETTLCNPDGLTESERQSIAYHEAGHTIVALVTHPEWFETTDIFPYGVELSSGCSTGITSLNLPADMSRDDVRDSIAIDYGGYVADLARHGHPTTGSSRDIRMATDFALSAIREWGMGETTPPYNLRLLREEGIVFNEHIALTESMEVRMLLDEGLGIAIAALSENDDKVILIAEALADAPSLRLNAVDISEVLAQQTIVDPVSVSTPE